MFDSIFSKEIVNAGRQREIDLVKAYSIIMMIITHCIDDLYFYEGHFISEFIDDVLAQTVGAQGFMICMGIGVAYTARGIDEKTLSSKHIKRGVSLLVTGQLLNLLRYGLPYFYAYLRSADVDFRACIFFVFSGDIFQFAGLFFLLMGLLTKLKLKSVHVFLLSIVMIIAGMLCCGDVNTGNYALDQFLGLFIFTNTESYFPLFHWMIYPAFGMVFGDVLLHVRDKKKFYTMLFVPTAIVFAIYYYVGLNTDQSVFTVFETWQSMSYMNIYDALMQLCCNTAVICICFFISAPLSEKAMQPVNFISKNILRYYCVHSVLVFSLQAILKLRTGGKFYDPEPCYAIALFMIIITTVIVYVYGKYMQKPVRSVIESHRGLFYGLVIVLSVLACIYAGSGIDWDYDSFPNMMNEYLEM